jgi:hypothetical protein
LGRCCIGQEEDLQKFPWMDVLSSGGLHQTGKDTVGFESGLRSRSETDFAKDDQMPERLFGVIVGGGNAGTSEEGKEKSLLGAYEIAAESLGGFETKRLFAEGIELPDKSFFDLGRLLPGQIASFELLSRVTES